MPRWNLPFFIAWAPCPAALLRRRWWLTNEHYSVELPRYHSLPLENIILVFTSDNMTEPAAVDCGQLLRCGVKGMWTARGDEVLKTDGRHSLLPNSFCIPSKIFPWKSPEPEGGLAGSVVEDYLEKFWMLGNGQRFTDEPIYRWKSIPCCGPRECVRKLLSILSFFLLFYWTDRL